MAEKVSLLNDLIVGLKSGYAAAAAWTYEISEGHDKISTQSFKREAHHFSMESSMHMHVEMTKEEHDALLKLKGSKTWKGWFFSITNSLREAANAVESAELREKLALKDVDDLETRCTRLQRDNRKHEENARAHREEIETLERRIIELGGEIGE